MPSKRRNEMGMAGNGGRFAPVGRSDADVHIATDQELIDALPHSPGFEKPVLGDRDSATVQDFGLKGFIADIEMWHDQESGATVAEVGVYVPDTELMGLEYIDDHDMSTEQSERVHRGTVVLDQIIRERYPDADVSYDGENPRMTWEYRAAGLSTEERMHDRAWNAASGPVTFANEADPGTFGHQYLGRNFRDRMEDTSMVGAPTLYDSGQMVDVQRSESDRANDTAAYAHFQDDGEAEMPTDANVRTYARRIAANGDQMKSLAERGHCSMSAAHTELDALTSLPGDRGTSRQRFEAFQLALWLDRSNQEPRDEWGL